ncbi:MAG: MarR family transcriptional regulator [Anaerolineae bacterium]|nr:MarR family transcriptional regulator [Anaerolineae bacterium]
MVDGSRTTHDLAEEILELMPSLGRLLALCILEAGEEETTVMQVSVLLHILKHPITTSELAKKRRVSLQAASVFVRGLVERGWVVRSPDPNDRRQFLLQITPEGLERAQMAQRQMTDCLAQSLHDLTPEEIAATAIFLGGLRRVVQAQMTLETDEEPYST